ncbi:TVP38/TMEM64 family protein [Tahibacter amnicola]|uniref:TVP38/TMEM64 family membrane protein n=1 Tax=Tahibacter amnicola TaxID=2976241 RepID=A0ABY6BBH4_9GAMM|nr:VTT domain-containing protein [Tahibacter amnicola]UXI67214.1 VTT domain-containing protein [Tahibacter amnicola]
MKRLRSLLPLFLLVGIGLALFFSGTLDRLRPETLSQEQMALRQQIAEHPVIASLIHIGVMALAISTGIPGAVVIILAGGMLFGALHGAVLSSIGVTLGALVLFFASRAAFGDHSHGSAPALVERLRGGYQAHPVSYTFFLRLVPFFPFGGVTVALAWLRCPVWLFLLATAGGGSVMTAIESVLGAGLAKNIAQTGKVDLSLMTDPMVIGPLIGVAALSLLPIAINRWRARKADAGATPPST